MHVCIHAMCTIDIDIIFRHMTYAYILLDVHICSYLFNDSQSHFGHFEAVWANLWQNNYRFWLGLTQKFSRSNQGCWSPWRAARPQHHHCYCGKNRKAITKVQKPNIKHIMQLSFLTYSMFWGILLDSICSISSACLCFEWWRYVCMIKQLWSTGQLGQAAAAALASWVPGLGKMWSTWR